MIIDNSHSDFSRSGLTIPSLIRTAFLIIKPSDTIAGAIGSVSRDTYRQLLSNLPTICFKQIIQKRSDRS